MASTVMQSFLCLHSIVIAEISHRKALSMLAHVLDPHRSNLPRDAEREDNRGAGYWSEVVLITMDKHHW
jgi:hypothetical protein